MTHKHPLPEDIFLDEIKKLIRNLFIDNPNYRNKYYSASDVYKIIEDTKERAQYILARINEIEHLIKNFEPKKELVNEKV